MPDRHAQLIAFGASIWNCQIDTQRVLAQVRWSDWLGHLLQVVDCCHLLAFSMHAVGESICMNAIGILTIEQQ